MPGCTIDVPGIVDLKELRVLVRDKPHVFLMLSEVRITLCI